MSYSSTVRSAAGWIARTTGYPRPIRAAINLAPVSDHVELADSSCVARGARLAGDISLEPDVNVCSTSDLYGDVTLGRGTHVGQNSVLHGHITTGPETTIEEDIEIYADMTIGDHVRLCDNGRIRGECTIGSRTRLNGDFEISGGDVDIGRYDAIAKGASFLNQNHLTNRAAIQSEFYTDVFGHSLEMPSKGPLDVGNDVWIGLKSTVLTGVTIGSGAVIGAGSVVTNDVDPYEIVAGCPAEHIGWRFDEQTREELLEIAWWDWDEEKIAENERFFHTDLDSTDGLYDLIV